MLSQFSTHAYKVCRRIKLFMRNALVYNYNALEHVFSNCATRWIKSQSASFFFRKTVLNESVSVVSTVIWIQCHVIGRELFPLTFDWFVVLFNDGHVLQLRPETVAVRRRIGNDFDDDGQMVSGDKCGLNFLTFVLHLREKPGKNLNQETDPTGIWIRARWMRGNDVTPRPQRWYLKDKNRIIYKLIRINIC